MGKLAALLVGLLVAIAVQTRGISASREDYDVFSSVAKMENLVHQERAIVDYLDTYLQVSKQRHQIIQK